MPGSSLLKSKSDRRVGALTAALAAAVLFSGCGPEAFKRGTLLSGQEAPGEFVVPAKVDIVLLEDDTGSFYEAHDEVARQIPRFLETLENSGWDYHFATVPLTSERTITEVLVSKHDTNYVPLGQWVAPFPGADPYNPNLGVQPGVFRTPGDYGGFISYAELSNDDNAWEPGLDTLVNVMNESNTYTSGFVRPDAMLVVITLSNGEDSSGGVQTIRSDGFVDYRDKTPLTYFENELVSIKGGDLQKVKFYSAVAPYTSALSGGTKCLGANARAGNRYIQMAASLGGRTYDICTLPVEAVLAGMSRHLQEQRLEFESSHILIEEEPDFNEDVRVYVHRGGTDRVEIPHVSVDPANGWEYIGWQTDLPLIDFPVPMNETTGYFIRLHGNSVLRGLDKPEVQYKAVGGRDSVSD